MAAEYRETWLLNPQFENTLAVILWSLWKSRNQLLFEAKTPNPYNTLMACNVLNDRYYKAFSSEKIKTKQTVNTKMEGPKLLNQIGRYFW